MAEPSTPIAELPGETSAKLARLVERTGRGRNALIGEAVAAYVDRELATVEAIERGRAQIRAGHRLGTDEVFGDVEAAIAGVESGRADR